VEADANLLARREEEWPYVDVRLELVAPQHLEGDVDQLLVE